MAAYTFNGLTVVEMTLTKGWGLTPASATIRAAGSSGIASGSDVTLNIGASVFSGVVTRSETVVQEGRFYDIEVADNRIKLNWDTVYCAFNMVEVIEDDLSTPGIDRKKRYWHIYPEDWHAQVKTYTNTPLSASTIFAKILAADTVNYGWGMGTHAKLSNPIYAFDALTGKKLSNCFQELCEKLGLQLAISGSYDLIFSEKGEGTVPVPDPYSTTNRSDGDALGSETRVRIVGDRNIYQDLPIALEPDWNTAYESYWFQPRWVDRVKSIFGISDRTEAEARAREVTLREYCDATSSANADHGVWGEVSRMEIPVWIYITDIVWKAYRIPSGYTVNNIALSSLDLREELLAAVDMNTSGAMAYKSPAEYYPDAKAAIMVQGMPLSMLDPTTENAFDLGSLGALATAWQPNNRFRLDTKNKTIIFEEATFIPGAGASALYVNPNEGISGAPQNIVVPNAGFSASAAVVRASLAFEAERFAQWYGSGSRQAPSYVSGINYHVLLTSGSWLREVTYADNEGALDKADAAADAFLSNQAYIQSGGFMRVGQAGMQLNGTISRITTRVAFTDGGESDGIQETIEYAKERAAGIFDSENELARRQASRDLFPGQSDLKEATRQLRLIAKLTKDAKRQVQRPYENPDDVMKKLPGNIHCSPTYAYPGSVTEFPVGRPLFVDDDLKASTTADRFFGVVSCNGLGASSKIIVATQGVVPVRVKCRTKNGETVKINAGDELEADPANDYAQAVEKKEETAGDGTGTSGGTSGSGDNSSSARVIGVAEDSYEGTEIAVIHMRITGGGANVKGTQLAGFQENQEDSGESSGSTAEAQNTSLGYLVAGVPYKKATTPTDGSGTGEG